MLAMGQLRLCFTCFFSYEILAEDATYTRTYILMAEGKSNGRATHWLLKFLLRCAINISVHIPLTKTRLRAKHGNGMGNGTSPKKRNYKSMIMGKDI